MNIQEIEEMEFNAGRATEMQNCLTEAEQLVAEKSAEVIPTGEGPISIIVSHTMFCRSTDAFAGMVVCQIHQVADHDAADAWVAAKYAGLTEETYDPEEHVEISPRRPAPVAEVAAEDSEEFPWF